MSGKYAEPGSVPMSARIHRAQFVGWAMVILLAAVIGVSLGPAARASQPRRAPLPQVLRLQGASPGWFSPEWRTGLLRRGGGLPHVARPGSLVAPAAPAARGWRLETAPNVAALPNGSLAAESCANTSACTAVGDYENAAGVEVALAERWNGSAWRVQGRPRRPGRC